MLRCTVVIPCYNEARRLPLDIFRQYIPSNPDIKFIFVNDGSKDATLAMLDDLRAQFPTRVEVIDKKQNQGKGAAVRDGMLRAFEGEADVAGFWDADLAAPLSAIRDLLEPLAANPEIQMVFGARVKLMGHEVERKTIRHYLGRLFATTVSVALALPIYDILCGAKLFRATPEIRRLFSEPASSRWVFDVELVARFMQSRRAAMGSVRSTIYEFPLQRWREVGGSKLRPYDFIRAFVDVARIYRHYHFLK